MRTARSTDIGGEFIAVREREREREREYCTQERIRGRKDVALCGVYTMEKQGGFNAERNETLWGQWTRSFTHYKTKNLSSTWSTEEKKITYKNFRL